MNSDWKFYALSSAFFAGLTAVFAKIGVREIPSNLATLLRTCVIILFLALWVGARHEWQNPLLFNRKSLIFLLLSGITTGLSWLFYFRALQSGPASLVAPLDKLSLLFSVVLAEVLLGEHLSRVQWAGVLIMTTGAFLIAQNKF